MSTAARLGLFGGVLAAVFAVAAGIGAAVGPIDVGDESGHDAAGAHGSVSSGALAMPRGLSVEAAGFRLELDEHRLLAGQPSTLTFRLVDGDGHPVTQFDELHERRLHLIVLNRDLVGYHHLHPTLSEDGTWTAELPALAGGSYRLFADTQPSGADTITLGADLLVVGDGRPAQLPEPLRSQQVSDLVVELSGDARVGESDLTFTVTSDGEPVTTEPYLGAAGHLVAIRADDLAFLHVHPHDAADGTSAVTFSGEFPSAGRYRLFFDFSVDGEVHTAGFTVDVPAGDDSHPEGGGH